MKLGGYWGFIFSISLIILVSSPVQADELYPTITDVYFTKGGVPWNESVQFTVNCYGYLCKSWDCEMDPSDRAAQNGNFTPELVFSYHATCPGYSCRIYEPYYHAERNFMTTCNLEGKTQGETFLIRNFSRSAVPQNCTDLRQFGRSGGRNRFYNETPEYRRCVNETRRNSLRCDQYLETCEPAKDNECGNWLVDGKTVKETSSYRACMDTSDRERTDCNRYLEKIDPNNLIMWNYSGYAEEPAMRRCELRFEIPPENKALDDDISPAIVPDPDRPTPDMTFGKRAVATAEYYDPAVTIYCSIVSFLGGKCG
jgi:hypothetical protein